MKKGEESECWYDQSTTLDDAMSIPSSGYNWQSESVVLSLVRLDEVAHRGESTYE